MVGLLVPLPTFKQTSRPFCRCQPPLQGIRGATSRWLGLSWSRSYFDQATTQQRCIDLTSPSHPARPYALPQTLRLKKKSPRQGAPQVLASITDYPPGWEEVLSRELLGAVWSAEHRGFWIPTSPHLLLESRGFPGGRRRSRKTSSGRPAGCLDRPRRMSSMPSTVSWEKPPMELFRQRSSQLRQPLALTCIKLKNISR